MEQDLNSMTFRKLGTACFVSVDTELKTYVYPYKGKWQSTTELYSYVDGTVKKKYSVKKYEQCPIVLQLEAKK